MDVDDIELAKLVDFIFKNISQGRWLYWPPGPMTHQVFDKEACKTEIRRFIDAMPIR